MTPELDILGVRVHLLSEADALAGIESLYRAGRPRFTSYVNPHTVNLAVEDGRFGVVLSHAALRFADGFGIRLAGLVGGVSVPAILNGSDFNEAVLRRAAARGWSVFLLGGRPGVAEKAAARLCERIPALHVAGTYHGYFDDAESAAVAERVRRSRAGILMVALGQPRQERWLAAHLGDSGARLGLAIGGFLDFSAGAVRRAPGWMNRCGVEWLFRLSQEPHRLARRYVIGTPVFLLRLSIGAICARQREWAWYSLPARGRRLDDSRERWPA
jgi:exopolysaccharide biosynthesis WecB/TagA/CpsF family protein